jgi:methylthioribose-1-phosphate isomerase
MIPHLPPPALPGLPVPVSWSEDGEAIDILDQTRLPVEERRLRLESVVAVADAIRTLRVRGAPAIGIAAAMGLALGVKRRAAQLAGSSGEPDGALEEGLGRDLELLRATRPTAVNLAWATERVARALREAEGGGLAARVAAVVREADAIALQDREMCRLIGVHGLEVIPAEGACALTHCNAGALATGGMGTALAPVYTAHARGIPISVFASETRPLLQGARLTAWELARTGIGVTVVTEGMVGALMARGLVGLVLVGADRVAANGDVANKVGTYGLAVLARHHGLPFYVALPRSTFDPAAPSGVHIPIEERDPAEVLGVAWGGAEPSGVGAWNPAFDLTPAHLVTAFISDGGVLRPPFPASIARVLAATPPGPLTPRHGRNP